MNLNLSKAIKQILIIGSTALYTTGLFAAVGQQNPPPGPGQIPDYFGVVPNFANSPQPVLTKVTVSTGSAVQPGSGASAIATLGAGGSITKITPSPSTGSGSGYVTPKVTITDQGIGSGAAVTVTTTATSGGALANTYNVLVAGSDCAVGDPLIISGNGAAEVSAVDTNTGAITAINVTSVGSGYAGAVSFTVDCTTGRQNGLNASGTLDVTPGTPGVIDSVTVNTGGGGANYSPNAKVIFFDPNRASGNTDAVAHVTVDPNGAITGVVVDNPGTGYTASTTAEIQDVGTGTGATATATAKKVNGVSGVITAVKVSVAGSGYRNPLIEISDANAGAAGQGAVLVATTYDYFSDVMTDKVMDVQVLNPGSGYDAGTIVNITGGPGSSGATATPIIVNGSIVGIEGIDIPDPNSAMGYIRDPNFTGLNLGSGFKLPIAGTGLRKFVDSLPLPNTANNLGQSMPVAVPDTITFPGSDYYEIEAVEHTEQLHSDLPVTHLRGYRQINNGTDNTGHNTVAPPAGTQYLGPTIIAQKDRPVRVKLVNHLSKSTDASGLKGHLPVPVDTTYMGADSPTDTDNRTALHLHGGNTPWISDGTPRQWVKPAGEVAPNRGESARNVPDMWFFSDGSLVPNSATCTQGTSTCTTPNASNDPGAGALTFFYTNEQSARLMFYHDHAEGTTRLNVYAGMAGGYILQDPTEQALVTNGTLPSLADTIPLVVQEKTFIPDNTNNPVLNFYGPFSSQLNSQDPTWRWGTETPATGLMGNGDLWVPHVFMPNQNPGDVSGANSVGRWDYGPWFWPPFVNIQNGEINNPYYDQSCDTTTTYCEGPKIPGVPNGSQQAVLSNGVPGGVHDATHGGAITESPSGTPEAFNDTPLVNGTAYPYINVDPKQYRLRILSVGNDRMLNLSMVVAASKNSVDTTAEGNAGTLNNTTLCDGSTAVDPADCTEVKMVPFSAAQNSAVTFPAWWYTKQKGGVTFDGRPSGVFDPRTRGPQMVQIGTEGGFLSSPVAIPNQPVNYEYNPKNILIGNIKEHALLLGPAERADVLVDFSNFAGSTIILYNDAGAPVPAWDLRLDYYTGNFDNTDTGGAFSVIPGYGPNSRTLMQFRVASTCSSSNCGPTSNNHPVDDLGTINMAGLKSAVQTAFKTSQEPIVVPQSTYNDTYGMSFVDALGADLSRISDNWLTYSPLSPRNPLGNFTLLPAVKLELEPKTIIEDWTMNWGRMNALLGTEVPHTTAINQTSIPQAFVDPPTDLVKITPNDNMVPISGTAPDGTQIWKITHNGVDSHAVHFHLFHVQLVNRVGWDGAVYPPDANELGWKDTVRMNPLSDTIVALRPMTMTNLPFKVPNSHRLLDPALAANAASIDFFNFSPLTGNGSNVLNKEVNYGWEYLWHCHILGHEENDMMRSIAVAQPPETPTALTATTIANGVKLDWTDNSIISNWVTIERTAVVTNTGQPNFNDPSVVSIIKLTKDLAVNPADIANGECRKQDGCSLSYTDTAAPVATSVYYRIKANNTVGAGDGMLDAPRNGDGSFGAFLPAALSGLTPGFTDYANVTANSEWSGTASRLAIPTATVTTTPASNPLALGFGNQLIGSTSGTQTVTVTNTGSGNLAIAGLTLSANSNFAATNCPASLAPLASCTISVTFTPTSLGSLTDTLTITDNTGGVAGSNQTIALSGTGTAPVANVSPSTLASFGNVNVGSTSAVQTVTLSNTGTAPLTIASIVPSAQFAIATVPAPAVNCATVTPVAPGASCVIGVTFKPTASGQASGNLVITDNSYPAISSPQTVQLSGTGISPVVLNAPTNLKATVTGTSVTLTWGDASTGETGYVVQRAPVTITAAGVQTVGTSATITTPSGNLAANATSVTNTGATAGLYAYRVYAVNGATNGASATVYAYTGTAMTIPGQPSANSAASNTTASIRVAWAASTPATNAITGYVVQRCSSGITYTGTSPTVLQQTAALAACNALVGTWTTVATTTNGSAGVTMTNAGLAGKTLYGYRVAATNILTGTITANSPARILWTN